jgi:glutathione S-transferase
MVKLTVYGNKESMDTLRVLILLEELQLEYTIDDTQSPSPFGQLAVKYGDRDLFESREILRYISKNNDNEPQDPEFDIQKVYQWLEVESQKFNPIITKILNTRNIETEKEQLELFDSILKIYNERLSHQKYIATTEFSIADISHIPCLNKFVKSSKEYKNFLKEYPHIYKWYKRITSRPCVKECLDQQLS